MDFGRYLQGARSDVSCLVSPPPPNLQSFVPLPACVVSLMQLRAGTANFKRKHIPKKFLRDFLKY